MGNFVCQECGRDNFYHAQRGTSLDDQISQCCRAPAARGRSVKDIQRNRPDGEWVTETRRVYVIKGWLQLSKESAGVRLDHIENGVAWFAAIDHGYLVVPDGWVAFYKLDLQTLLALRWTEQAQRQHDKECA